MALLDRARFPSDIISTPWRSFLQLGLGCPFGLLMLALALFAGPLTRRVLVSGSRRNNHENN